MSPWRKAEFDPVEKEILRACRKIKFLADENISLEIVGRLRKDKTNVKTVADFGYIGRSDEDIYKLAYREKRMLLTRDKEHYMNNRRFPLNQTAGVLLLASNTNSEMVSDILAMIQAAVVPYAEYWCNSKIKASYENITAVFRNACTGKIERELFRLSSKGYWMEWVDE